VCCPAAATQKVMQLLRACAALLLPRRKSCSCCGPRRVRCAHSSGQSSGGTRRSSTRVSWGALVPHGLLAAATAAAAGRACLAPRCLHKSAAGRACIAPHCLRKSAAGRAGLAPHCLRKSAAGRWALPLVTCASLLLAGQVLLLYHLPKGAAGMSRGRSEAVFWCFTVITMQQEAGALDQLDLGGP